jgi:nucleotide-binding universal stress UspA family protein
VRHTTRLLATVPDRTPLPPGPPRRIAVGVDGSDDDQAAVTWTHDLAQQIDAEVFVVVEDDLAPTLADAAAQHDADLVVVGGNSLGSVVPLRIDRSSMHAVDDIPLPTVVVPPPD